jgi:hypothetical protein
LPPSLEAIAQQPHLVGCSTPGAEGPSIDASQKHQQHVRFPRHSSIDPPSRSFRFPLPSEETNAMTLNSSPPVRDVHALGRSDSTQRRTARPPHLNQLDLARFGLSRLCRADSTRSNQPDKSTRRARRPSNVAERPERPTRFTSLRVSNNVHQARPKDKLRRQSIHSPTVATFQTSPQRPTGVSSSSTHNQRRSVSLWARRITKGDSAYQQCPTSDESQENDAPDDEHAPLTEAQRIQSLRRGRKLTQVCG